MDNTSNLVSKAYIGIDNVARKITKMYRGVNGVAKLVYSGKQGYLYGGTSTFVHTAGSLVTSMTDYTLTTDSFTIDIEKYDTIPLYVYIDNELGATITTEGERTVTINGVASTLASRGTVTVTVTSEGGYSLGEQSFYQFWDLNTDSKSGTGTSAYSSLTSATLSDNIVNLRDTAFLGTEIESLSLPDSITAIGAKAFYECFNLTSINIPSSVTSIGENAFYGCSALTSIDISNGVTSIDTYAFYGCSALTSINIPSSVTYFGNNVFYKCSSLTSINIPSGVTHISYSLCAGCSSLTSIDISNGVTSIDKYAFSDCSALTSINIPSSVTSIGANAFDNCSNLTSITFEHGESDTLSISMDSVTPSKPSFYIESSLATTVYHRGNPSVLNYDWVACNRTVTFIQE